MNESAMNKTVARNRAMSTRERRSSRKNIQVNFECIGLIDAVKCVRAVEEE